MAYDARLAERVREELQADPGFSERKMFGGLCFMLHGNMCAGVVGDRLMLRLGRGDPRPRWSEATSARWTSPASR
jgi:TfoX/Sxy family transcriptional regulator of competence genes